MPLAMFYELGYYKGSVKGFSSKSISFYNIGGFACVLLESFMIILADPYYGS